MSYAGVMKISQRMLDKFISIFEAEFGEQIDSKDAEEMASRLLMLYEQVATKSSTESARSMQQDDDHRQIGFRTGCQSVVSGAKSAEAPDPG
jgi:hypothetical protein